jgi:hypothetical protein
LLGIPIQTLLMKFMYRQRMNGIAITDQRVQLTNEVGISNSPSFLSLTT